MEYNGFSNWETHNVAMWMSNDEELSRRLLQLSEQPDGSGELKRFVEYVYGKVGIFGDIETKKELKQVNWQEIIETVREA